MAQNLTSLLFTRGLWCVVWEQSDGRQYVIVDNDGREENKAASRRRQGSDAT